MVSRFFRKRTNVHCTADAKSTVVLMPKILHSLLPKLLHFWLPFTLMNEAHTLDRASRLNLITSLERLLAHQSGDIDKILESERNSLNVEIKDEDYSQDEDGRSVFVVIKTLDKIFKKLGIVQKADNLKLARLYAFISGYKYTTIKNRLPVDDDIPERSKDEVR